MAEERQAYVTWFLMKSGKELEIDRLLFTILFGEQNLAEERPAGDKQVCTTWFFYITKKSEIGLRMDRCV
jgi:hypothetical protein